MSDIQTTATTTYRSRRGRRVLGLVLVMLVVLLGLAGYLLLRLVSPRVSTDTTVDTGGSTWVSSLYGMSNDPKDQLDRVQAAVSAPDGSIWVTDSVHRSLMRFTSDGRFTRQIKGPSDAPLQIPSRITIGPDGLIYVCETAGDAIRVIRPNNTDGGSFGIPKPVSVAVSDDRIVVGSVAGFAILDKKGKPVKVIGSRGKGNGQFDYVHGVAIGPDGRIYVVDSYNNRVSAYTPAGKRLWIIRTGKPSNSAELVNDSLAPQDTSDMKLTGDQAMQLPLGLTLDGAGRLVVVDMFDGSLVALDSKDGSFIAKYGETGAEDGQFFYPVSVSYDADRDWFLVADSLNNRAQVIRIPGSAASGGASAAAAFNRALSGPLRALVPPLVLVILVAIGAFIVPAVRKRRARSLAAHTSTGGSEDVTVDVG